MIYPYMTLPDETEITHSEILTNNGKEQVKIYIETPVEGGFKDATCILPDYEWENHGYSEEEMKYYKDFVEKAAHLFFKFARGGGFENAANFQHRLIKFHLRTGMEGRVAFTGTGGVSAGEENERQRTPERPSCALKNDIP